MQVNWTESAANQAKVILAGEEAGLNVRCFIQGGGCSGFQYGFTLDQQKEDDYVFETNGAKLLIDPMSGVYFNGATIDYKDVKLLKRFTNDNGKIMPRRVTGTSAKMHRKVVGAIKRARTIGLMPFVDSGSE